ncbi:hypothetical protein CONLIGDRAFT_673422 [Coniochaeta ligniaria NRRL 30616]|uniref:protein-ribulosamine 3-kinase n=1 Tax=Coniochaeta ligniaria NRRL 30616 TaxID=1408157 RepID=A0A1J7J685_9PEZI|nr:hypothetical protein CONLIGDRAFT_673422 [Coniochaeta ligniaria NRRL 30616]
MVGTMYSPKTLVDPAILKALPKGSVVVNVINHGKTNWAKGFKVEVETPNGQEKAYFLKIMDRESALEMATGEFESLVAMRQYIPNNVAKAVGVGPLEDDCTKSYFIVEFKNMRPEKPSPQTLAAVLSKMHQTSESPTGAFGFPVPTYKGYFRVNNNWCEKWEDWFSREFRQTVQNYCSRRGPDPELAELFEEFSAKVIPRLLRPLETGGRHIKPTLCHSDLWHGNAALDLETQECIIFDPCLDLSYFRGERSGWSYEYIEEYVKLVQPSEPREDFDDRNALYVMRNHIVSASLWDHWLYIMDNVKDEMRRLLAKHPDGFAGFKET